MDSFADIFLAYQKRGNATNAKGMGFYHLRYSLRILIILTEKEEMNRALQKWSTIMEKGKSRADHDKDGFTIKCV